MNLSKKFRLSHDQKKLLEKGLTFIPTINTHKHKKLKTTQDLQVFQRRVALAALFEHKGNTEQTPFTHKSTWTPKWVQLPPVIRRFFRANAYALKTHDWGPPDTPNVSKRDIKALRQLKNNPHIIIKPADKGSAIVIMDREHYVWEANRQLDNTEHYQKLDKPIFPDTIPLITKIIQEMNQQKYINHKQKTYLLETMGERPRIFYLLPKVHKEPEKWSTPFVIPPGRPIVSDCSSDTYRIAEFIEHHLNPISNRHPSYIKDTYDFIDKIKNLQIPQTALLFTIDIDSLYTNIDTTAGLKAVREWLGRYPDRTRPDTHLLQLLEINLTRNDFQFDDKNYLQIRGTAMGKRFAPSYANIYMAAWEEEALKLCPVKPLIYLRFLDDIWGVWTDTKDNFDLFIHTLNSHHTCINIKHSIDITQINFLDTITYKGPTFSQTNTLDIKMYFKDTDTHALLHRRSFHPRHVFGGIVKSQLLRFSRICTRAEDFWEATRTLCKALEPRGYSRTFLRKAIKTFNVRRQKDGSTLLPLITDYARHNTTLHTKIKQNFNNTIGKTGTLQKHKIISALRRHKNLKDILVQSKLKPIQPPKTKSRLCPEFRRSQWVTNSRTKEVFKTQTNLTPLTTNCVYLIWCKICGLKYVGETKNNIATRMHQHRYTISKRKNTHRHVTQHFMGHGLNSLIVTGLQACRTWTTRKRKYMESWWIQKLDTEVPSGLNENRRGKQYKNRQ